MIVGWQEQQLDFGWQAASRCGRAPFLEIRCVVFIDAVKRALSGTPAYRRGHSQPLHHSTALASKLVFLRPSRVVSRRASVILPAELHEALHDPAVGPLGEVGVVAAEEHDDVPRAACDRVARVLELAGEHDHVAGGGGVNGHAEAAEPGAAALVLCGVVERDGEGEDGLVRVQRQRGLRAVRVAR